MSRPARQVRSVRLRGPDEGSIRRGARLLEDALHTASLPDATGGRLLVVRSLQCGTIRAGQSPASLALAIEQRMRQLGPGAIYAEEQTAATAVAVYFHDAVEPYIRLALRLARHEPTRAWFWPLAVPGWQDALPRDDALRLVLQAVGETETGPAAVARLVRALLEGAALPPLLAALRWQDGPALLRASGWRSPGTSLSSPADSWSSPDEPPDALALPIPERWREPLAEWIGGWGLEDARSVWLAHVALVAEQPARLLDARLALRARRLIELLTRPPLPPASAETDSRPPTHAAATVRDAADPASATLADRTSEPDDRATPIAGPAAASSPPAARHGSSTVEPPAAESIWADGPQPSAYAGLFFALPVLERLGMAGLLVRRPELIELSLPDLVLRAVARRVGSPADDPVLWTLAAPPLLARSLRLGWVAPPSWCETLAQPGPLVLRRIAGTRAGRVLCDGSGRLPLALWHGRAPDELRELLRTEPLRRGSSLPAQPDLDLLLDAWLIALRRWCRRHAGLGLVDLVSRPGRIVATRTHVDVLLDHRQADLRVRRVGLDIDPGWLPWFGRVVLFHYLYGEL